MNKLYYILIIFFIPVISGCKKDVASDCNCIIITPAPDKYEYPFEAGSPEWNAAGTAGGLDSIYKLCQVPQNLVINMSTLGLVQTLEENPMLFNMLLRDNKFSGRNEVLSRLNVSWELNKRVDAASKIMDYYNTKNPCCVENITGDAAKGAFALSWYFFDMICTQDSLLNKLDNQGKKNFAKIIIDKYSVQLKYPDTFGSSKASSAIILSQLMIKENFQQYLTALQSNSDLNYFASTGILTSDNNCSDILHYANLFSNN